VICPPTLREATRWAHPQQEDPTFVLAINHPVADDGKWKTAYDTLPPTSRGAKFARVNRDIDDPNLITVVAGFDSLRHLLRARFREHVRRMIDTLQV
jgi:hypothetical protein